MSITNKLNKIFIEAIKNKDIKRFYIRNIRTRITEYLVANKLPRDVAPSDELVIEIISKYTKSLEKAIKLMGTGSLVDEYQLEIAFCSQFLPNEEDQKKEIEEKVKEVIEELNAGPKDMGKVMGIIMKNNNFDGRIVKEIVIKQLKENK